MERATQGPVSVPLNRSDWSSAWELGSLAPLVALTPYSFAGRLVSVRSLGGTFHPQPQGFHLQTYYSSLDEMTALDFLHFGDML